MEQLNLPTYTFRIQEGSDKSLIFDPIRKKYVTLTPEEWVRQHILAFLYTDLGYPRGLIEVEKGLDYSGMKWRADALAYSVSGNPILLVECKAPNVAVTQQTFDQISRYNLVFQVPFLLVTNGLAHYCCKIDMENRSYEFLEKIPSYEEQLVS